MLRGLLLEKLLRRELRLLLREPLLRETVRQHERFIFAAWSPPGGAGGSVNVVPQTVLALWGSGVFKAGDCAPRFPASRTFPDTENH